MYFEVVHLLCLLYSRKGTIRPKLIHRQAFACKDGEMSAHACEWSACTSETLSSTESLQRYQGGETDLTVLTFSCSYCLYRVSPSPPPACVPALSSVSPPPPKKRKDTILLDRCVLEDKTKEIDDQYKEEAARLRVEFQLERSTLRKQCREVSAWWLSLLNPSPQVERPVLCAHS